MELNTLIANVEKAAENPIDRVTAAVALKEQMEQAGDDLLDHFIGEARDAGCSWTEIGDALGVTRQAAQQRQGGFLSRVLDRLSKDRHQRFTPRARQAVVTAQTTARERRHQTIGTEHLLLGILADGDNVAVKALAAIEADRAEVERRLDEKAPPGDQPPPRHLPFSALATSTMEDSLAQAVKLGHNYIGTEHMVLALLDLGEGTAFEALSEAGVSYQPYCEAVVAILHT